MYANEGFGADMIKNYTQDAKRRCLALIDSDIESIWNSIEQMPTDTDSQKWKKKLKSIAKEYTFSSRFALMRIFLPFYQSVRQRTAPRY